MGTDLEHDLALAHEVASLVADEGGRAYFVGGYVRDRLLGTQPNDVDIEVFGIDGPHLRELLLRVGKPQTYGAAYEIFSIAGSGLDVSLPHRQTVTSDGTVGRVADHSLSPQEAARRRDLTIDALMEDVLTGQVIDYFGGISDLENRILRHVDATTFAEDPLRVFRVASHAARLQATVDPATIELCRNLDVTHVSAERVLQELEKALMLAARPSTFFRLLNEMGQLSGWFKEIGALIGCEQNPVYHPEGDVFVHTMDVVDYAALMRDEAHVPFAFMLSALCHDVGKPLTTCVREGHLTSWGHEKEGVKPARELMRRLKVSHDVVRYVTNMVELHMRPGMLVANVGSHKSYRRCFNASVDPCDLIMLSMADRMGTGALTGNAEVVRKLTAEYEDFNRVMELPAVRGRDLSELGAEPGPLLGQALRYAEKLHLAGVSKQDALIHSMSYYRKLVTGREGETA